MIDLRKSKRDTLKLENLGRGDSVQIKIFHKGCNLDGWGSGYTDNDDFKEEFEATWVIKCKGNNKNRISIELLEYILNDKYFPYGSEESRKKGHEFIPEIKILKVDEYVREEFDLLLENIKEKYNPIDQEEITLDEFKELDWYAHQDDYDHSYKLFQEIVEIEWNNGKKIFREAFQGSSHEVGRVMLMNEWGDFRTFFDMFSKLEFQQSFVFYHIPPLVSDIKLRIRGVKPLIRCIVPHREFLNLHNMWKNFDNHNEGITISDFIYVLPTLNGRIYYINLGEIQELIYELDENNRTYPVRKIFKNEDYGEYTTPGKDILYMPSDIHVLFKNENSFIDIDIYDTLERVARYNLCDVQWLKDEDMHREIGIKEWITNHNLQRFLPRNNYSVIKLINITILALDYRMIPGKKFGALGYHYSNFCYLNPEQYRNSKNEIVDRSGKIL